MIAFKIKIWSREGYLYDIYKFVTFKIEILINE